jgi:hypothetical protein
MLTVGGYTRREIVEALTASHQKWRFEHWLLDNVNTFIRKLDVIRKGTAEITYDGARSTMRTFRASIDEPVGYTIDPLSQRIQPWAILEGMPRANNETGAFEAWFPLGVYQIAAITEQYTSRGKILLIEADDLAFLFNFCLTDDLQAPQGTAYLDLLVDVAQLSGVPAYMVEDIGAICAIDRHWAYGTSYLEIITALTSEAGLYWYFDDYGVFKVVRWLDPALRSPIYDYADDALSVLGRDFSRKSADLMTPNYVRGTVSRPTDGIYFWYEESNQSSSSPYSVPNRGFVAATRESFYESQAPTYEALQVEVRRKLLALSSIKQPIDFQIGLMPFHGPGDVVNVTHSRLGVTDEKYIVSTFTLPLSLKNWMVLGLTPVPVVS